jgi:hypothetical protein
MPMIIPGLVASTDPLMKLKKHVFWSTVVNIFVAGKKPKNMCLYTLDALGTARNPGGLPALLEQTSQSFLHRWHEQKRAESILHDRASEFQVKWA